MTLDTSEVVGVVMEASSLETEKGKPINLPKTILSSSKFDVLGILDNSDVVLEAVNQLKEII